ncbi:MAG: hypothetical protein CMQ53_00995 [Gammaproteobacteria bacterium]|nr:hypothetical protein [Gammaproteobacteria bacterium]|tara:strand:+ start:1985 stop:2821 length:837 start_codon:yes stop_codon:yes gene_type:complete
MSDEILVSVVMSLFNPDKPLLKKSIESLSSQSYTNIEIIIIDDGMNAEDIFFLKSLIEGKENFFVYKNIKNIGLTKSLNIAISKSNGELIARNDADDISDKNRIEKQVNYFKKNKEVGVLGTWYSVTNDNERKYEYRYSNDHNILLEMLFERNPFCHSSVMIKKDILKKLGGYNPKYKVSQDLDLWFRISKNYSLNILQENLVERHLSKKSISMSSKRWMQLFNSLFIRLNYVSISEKTIVSIYKIFKTFFKGVILNISPSLTHKLKKLYRIYLKTDR